MKNPFRKRWRILEQESVYRNRPNYTIQSWSIFWPFSWWNESVSSTLRTPEDAQAQIELMKRLAKRPKVIWRGE